MLETKESRELSLKHFYVCISNEEDHFGRSAVGTAVPITDMPQVGHFRVVQW